MNKPLKYTLIGVAAVLVITAAAAAFIVQSYLHDDDFGGNGFADNPESHIAERLALDLGESYIAERLELNGEQRTLLNEIGKEAFAIRGDLNAQRRRGLRDLLSLLDDKNFDRLRAADMAKNHTSDLNQYAARAITIFGDFVDSLDSDQREELRELVQDFRGQRWDLN